jgi:hypothetical protein
MPRIKVDTAGVVDVEDAGRQFENDAPDDKDQAQPFEHLSDRPPRRPDEQLGHHGPELGQDHRDQDQAQHDMGASMARYSQLGCVGQLKR